MERQMKSPQYARLNQTKPNARKRFAGNKYLLLMAAINATAAVKVNQCFSQLIILTTTARKNENQVSTLDQVIVFTDGCGNLDSLQATKFFV